MDAYSPDHFTKGQTFCFVGRLLRVTWGLAVAVAGFFALFAAGLIRDNLTPNVLIPLGPLDAVRP